MTIALKQPAGATDQGVKPFYSDDTLRNLLTEKKQAEALSWRGLSLAWAGDKKYYGHLYYLLGGGIIRKPSVREALRLVPYHEIPVCPTCRKVHRIVKVCGVTPQVEKKPTTRISVSKIDHVSTAKTLHEHAQYPLEDLIKELWYWVYEDETQKKGLSND